MRAEAEAQVTLSSCAAVQGLLTSFCRHKVFCSTLTGQISRRRVTAEVFCIMPPSTGCSWPMMDEIQESSRHIKQRSDIASSLEVLNSVNAERSGIQMTS